MRRCYAVLFVYFLCVSAHAQWTNGQNAQYVLGQSDWTSHGSAAGSTGMNKPSDAVIDFTNNKLYVSDSMNNRVLRFAYPITGNQPSAEAVFGQADMNGHMENRDGSPAANTLFFPIGLALDGSGRLYVADTFNHRVLRFDSPHTAINGVDADFVLGQSDTESDVPGTSNAALMMPMSLAFDAVNDRLWVVEVGNHRVLRFESMSTEVSGSCVADGVLGQADFESGSVNRDGSTAANSLNMPYDITLDGSGRLWVADTSNNRVLRYDNAAAKVNGANADGVLGQDNFNSNFENKDGPAAAGTMDLPMGLALDPTGRLYVADDANWRVLIFNLAASKADGANADNVLGQPDFATTDFATTQALMSFTCGLATDNANDVLVVTDQGNNRVVVFQASASLPVSLSSFELE